MHGLFKADVQSLVIAGEKEPKAIRESVKDIVQVLPHAKGILLRGSRHDIPWKSSDDFNCIIREWINDKNLTSDNIQPF